jgi:hypothetical protein
LKWFQYNTKYNTNSYYVQNLGMSLDMLKLKWELYNDDVVQDSKTVFRYENGSVYSYYVHDFGIRFENVESKIRIV